MIRNAHPKRLFLLTCDKTSLTIFHALSPGSDSLVTTRMSSGSGKHSTEFLTSLEDVLNATGTVCKMKSTYFDCPGEDRLHPGVTSQNCSSNTSTSTAPSRATQAGLRGFTGGLKDKPSVKSATAGLHI